MLIINSFILKLPPCFHSTKTHCLFRISLFAANNHNVLSPFKYSYLLLFFEIACNAIKSAIIIEMIVNNEIIVKIRLIYALNWACIC